MKHLMNIKLDGQDDQTIKFLEGKYIGPPIGKDIHQTNLMVNNGVFGIYEEDDTMDFFEAPFKLYQKSIVQKFSGPLPANYFGMMLGVLAASGMYVGGRK